MKRTIINIKKKCFRCDCDFIGNKSYCLSCHANYMKNWRLRNPLTEDQKKKATSRSILNVNVKRKKINKMPCEVCGEINVEAHHDDYDKPLQVRWLCRPHHLEHHAHIA
jgi:hypothetical protein